jgi:transketolase
MSRAFGPRRATWVEVAEPVGVTTDEVAAFERFDTVYRALCAFLYNFAQSGHPGGSISSGRFVAGLLFDGMDYDIGSPNRRDQDLISYSAGHKAMGLYAMWALRDEVARIARPDLLPNEENLRLRFEDLLGFRRNLTQPTPLFREFHSKSLDGHPTPVTPFVRLSTGASGIGVGSSLGLAVGAADAYGEDAPWVHLIEGEGGLTPGRATEAAAFAGTSGLSNAIVHLDWNQASIDSDAVTREGSHPGEYVQWDPCEFFYLHDWNVIHVPDGFNIGLVLTAQRMATEMGNGQPTAIVYRTTKGWQYGIEGKKSHGAGHKMCSEEYFETQRPLFGDATDSLPSADGSDAVAVEAAQWETLLQYRALLEADTVTPFMADRLASAKDRLDADDRKPRENAPDVERIYAAADPTVVPEDLVFAPGESLALRQALGRTLGYLNRESGGAILIGAADLLGSTAISDVASGFPEGFYHRTDNPGARSLSVGGICEDGLSCVLSGASAFGDHVGAVASYGAFLAPLGHIASRLHAIGNQMRQETEPGPYRPFVLVCAHAGMKTGEDGPTHADPQALQLLQENFVGGTAVTLTPWEPAEVWPLVAAAFRVRPAIIAPFVTRPGEVVPDREALGLAPVETASRGFYKLRSAAGTPDGSIVLQGSAVTYAFVGETLPLLEEAGIDLDVYLVTSSELFDRLSAAEQHEIFPDAVAQQAMGITGFTLPTMYRWIRSELGRANTMYPFQNGRYLSSGVGEMVVHEAGLDGEGQIKRIKSYVEMLAKAR